MEDLFGEIVPVLIEGKAIEQIPDALGYLSWYKDMYASLLPVVSLIEGRRDRHPQKLNVIFRRLKQSFRALNDEVPANRLRNAVRHMERLVERFLDDLDHLVVKASRVQSMTVHVAQARFDGLDRVNL